ncbi:MAG: transposase [Spirochaetota bacterium]
MTLYDNRYRIESSRLQGYDYSQNGAYFITICTKNREQYFGTIINGVIHHSQMGEIVKHEWLKTPQLRPDMNIVLDEFIIMPDHMHMIFFINNRRDAMHGVSTMHGEYKNKFGPQSKNVASIIRGFKSSVTMYARKQNIPFNWQTGYYDRIIRDDVELYYIRKYIINNPLQWEKS